MTKGVTLQMWLKRIFSDHLYHKRCTFLFWFHS